MTAPVGRDARTTFTPCKHSPPTPAHGREAQGTPQPQTKSWPLGGGCRVTGPGCTSCWLTAVTCSAAGLAVKQRSHSLQSPRAYHRQRMPGKRRARHSLSRIPGRSGAVARSSSGPACALCWLVDWRGTAARSRSSVSNAHVSTNTSGGSHLCDSLKLMQNCRNDTRDGASLHCAPAN